MPRSHYSVFVQKQREQPPFLWRFCADHCEHFQKNGGFSSVFVQKTEQCERVPWMQQKRVLTKTATNKSGAV